MKIKKVLEILILAFLFLLPWQTRWIYGPAFLNNGSWEYGTLSLYSTEILLWIVILFFVLSKVLDKNFWAKIREKEKQVAYRKRGAIGLAILAGVAFLLWRTDNWLVAYQSVLRWLGGFCLMVVLWSVGDGKKQIVSLWLGGVGQGVLAVWQFLSQEIGANKWLGLAAHSAKDLGVSVIEFGDERWLRAYGSFGWPNALGIFLAVILVCGVWLYVSTENYRHKLLILLGQFAVLSGLILSFSRGAWLGAVLGLMIFFILQKKGRWEIGKNLVYYSLVILLFFIAIKPLFLTRIKSLERLEIKSVAERQDQIKDWKNIFSKNYWWGVGPGLYTEKLYQKNSKLPVWEYQPVHNVYLLGLVEWGAIGSLGWLAFLAWVIYKIFKNNKIFLSCWIVLIVAGLFDHWLLTMFTGIIFGWVILGLTRLEKNDNLF